jgi:hypothetical protein
MRTRDSRFANEMLRRALLQRNSHHPLGDFSSAFEAIPGSFLNNDRLQGGLPARLIALQMEPRYQHMLDGSSGDVSSHRLDPNFRRLSRASQTEGVATPAVVQGITAGGFDGSYNFERPKISRGSRIYMSAGSISPLGAGEQGVAADGPDASGSLPNIQRYRVAGPTHKQCVDQCIHLLPSPSGDLQSSEYRQCYRNCMGRLL